LELLLDGFFERGLQARHFSGLKRAGSNLMTNAFFCIHNVRNDAYLASRCRFFGNRP